MNIPKLSVVVIVHRMPRQAGHTLHSLSSEYQQGVDPKEYEVIVVENASNAPLGQNAATRHGFQFRYFYREESSRSPVGAVNFGVEQARAPMVCIMIDGARMVTPGVVINTLRAQHLATTPVVSVPGYHLGDVIQQEAVDSGYNQAVEEELLESIAWPSNGYRLFEIACLSGSCTRGFFRPMSESNCLALPKRLYDDIGGCDPRFDLPGGGMVNLDLYRRTVEHPDSELIVLPGEGSFHQFHGGLSTNVSKKSAQRQSYMREIKAQYAALRGQEFRPPQKPATYLGQIPSQAVRFVIHSASQAAQTSSG